MTRYIDYRQRCGAQGANSVFLDENGEPLMRTVFVAKLKTGLLHLGFDSNENSGHSFRIVTLIWCKIIWLRP